MVMEHAIDAHKNIIIKYQNGNIKFNFIGMMIMMYFHQNNIQHVLHIPMETISGRIHDTRYRLVAQCFDIQCYQTDSD